MIGNILRLVGVGFGLCIFIGAPFLFFDSTNINDPMAAGLPNALSFGDYVFGAILMAFGGLLTLVSGYVRRSA